MKKILKVLLSAIPFLSLFLRNKPNSDNLYLAPEIITIILDMFMNLDSIHSKPEVSVEERNLLHVKKVHTLMGVLNLGFKDASLIYHKYFLSGGSIKTVPSNVNNVESDIKEAISRGEFKGQTHV